LLRVETFIYVFTNVTLLINHRLAIVIHSTTLHMGVNFTTEPFERRHD